MSTDLPPDAPRSRDSAGVPAGSVGRRHHPARWAAGIVAAAMVALLAVLATRPPAVDTAAQSPLVGRTAPEISGSAFGGGPVRLSGMRGRFVLVNFFAGWCAPCRAEAPELVELVYGHRQAGDLGVVGVAFNDSDSDASQFLRSSGAVWPGIQDPGGRIALAWGVQAPPQSFLVAPDGRVVAKIVGGVTAAGVDKLISRARLENA